MHVLFGYKLKCFAILSESASQILAYLLRKTIKQQGIAQCSIISFTEKVYEQSHPENMHPEDELEISYIFENNPEGISRFIPVLLETIHTMKQDPAFTEEDTLLALKEELEIYAKDLDTKNTLSTKDKTAYSHSFFSGFLENEEIDLYSQLTDQIVKKNLGSNEKLINFIGGSDANIFTNSRIDLRPIKNDTESLSLFIELLESIFRGPPTSYSYKLKRLLAKLKLLYEIMLTRPE